MLFFYPQLGLHYKSYNQRFHTCNLASDLEIYLLHPIYLIEFHF